MLTLSEILNPFPILAWRWESATNDLVKLVSTAAWYTDLISSIPNSVTCAIVLTNSVEPLIEICSPTIKDPEVWVTWKSLTVLAAVAYPLAPLLKPLI